MSDQPPDAPADADPLGSVTKTNVTDYYRCPRAYWLIAQGVITHEESISPYDLPKVEAGVEFERDLVASVPLAELDDMAPAVEMTAPGQPTLTLQTGLWVHHEMGLRGEPGVLRAAHRQPRHQLGRRGRRCLPARGERTQPENEA